MSVAGPPIPNFAIRSDPREAILRPLSGANESSASRDIPDNPRQAGSFAVSVSSENSDATAARFLCRTFDRLFQAAAERSADRHNDRVERLFVRARVFQRKASVGGFFD